MKKSASILALAILGMSSAQADDTVAQVVQPCLAPVVADQDTVKSYMEMQRKAYQQFLAYQRELAANTPEFLKIPSIPRVPTLNEHFPKDAFAMVPQMPMPFQLPADANMEQTVAERQKQLEEKRETVQARLAQRQESLDSTR